MIWGQDSDFNFCPLLKMRGDNVFAHVCVFTVSKISQTCGWILTELSKSNLDAQDVHNYK